MSQENLISTTIPAETLAAINTSLATINTALANILLFNLIADERKAMRVMGDKSIAFVQKALEYAENNPALLPPYLDLAEAKKDFVLAHDLYGIQQQINILQRAVEDTMMVAGSEAYDTALIFYNSVKGASRVNVPGSEAVYNDLQQRFAVKPQKNGSKINRLRLFTGNHKRHSCFRSGVSCFNSPSSCFANTFSCSFSSMRCFGSRKF